MLNILIVLWAVTTIIFPVVMISDGLVNQGKIFHKHIEPILFSERFDSTKVDTTFQIDNLDSLSLKIDKETN